MRCSSTSANLFMILIYIFWWRVWERSYVAIVQSSELAMS